MLNKKFQIGTYIITAVGAIVTLLVLLTKSDTYSGSFILEQLKTTNDYRFLQIMNEYKEETQKPISLTYIMTKVTQRLPELYAGLTSILETRSCPIEFNFAVDQITKDHLLRYFENVKVPQVNVNFHSLGPAKKIWKGFKVDLERFETSLLKGSPELILPENITETAILDFDFIILDDLCRPYHKNMEAMRKDDKVAVGVAIEHTTVYSGGQFPKYSFNESKRWDENWNGLNAGVYLAKLDKMREMGWTQTLKDLLPAQLEKQSDFLVYPEQNMMNLLGRDRPELFHELSPAMNFQLLPIGVPDVIKHMKIHNGTEDSIIIFHGNGGKWEKDPYNQILNLYLDLQGPLVEPYGRNLMNMNGKVKTAENRRNPRPFVFSVLEEFLQIK